MKKRKPLIKGGKKLLQESWNKILAAHHERPFKTTKLLPKKMSTPIPVNERAPTYRPKASDSSIGNASVSLPTRYEDEEMQAREEAARAKHHTSMPLHKGGYVLVTDPKMIAEMGKKVV